VIVHCAPLRAPSTTRRTTVAGIDTPQHSFSIFQADHAIGHRSMRTQLLDNPLVNRAAVGSSTGRCGRGPTAY